MNENLDREKNTHPSPSLSVFLSPRAPFILVMLVSILSFTIMWLRFNILQFKYKDLKVIRAVLVQHELTTLYALGILGGLGLFVLLFYARRMVLLKRIVDGFTPTDTGLKRLSDLVEPGLAPAVDRIHKHLALQEEVNLGTRNQRDEYHARSEIAEDVVRTVPTGIIVLSRDLKIRNINSAARSFMNLHMADLGEKHLGELLELPQAVMNILEEIQSDPEGYKARSTLEKSLGGVAFNGFVLDCQIRSVRGIGGAQKDDILILLEDVTAREKARAHMVDNERMAVMGRMGAQITHEIRNPLSSIGLNVELLGDDASFLPQERQKEFMQIVSSVRQEIDRLSELSESYLRLARLPESGNRSVDLSELVEDITEFQVFEAERLGIELSFETHLKSPIRSVVPGRIRQALLNLLRNSFEAIERDGQVRVGLWEEPDNMVLFRIDDTGPGIPEEMRPQIFESFYTTKTTGNGLGLSICAEVARDYDGSIQAKNSPLGGAQIEMRLRLEMDDARVSPQNP